MVWHHECNEQYLSNFKNLKLIVRYGVGVNIDLQYCKKRKIKVANTPDYGVDEVVIQRYHDYVFCQINWNIR